MFSSDQFARGLELFNQREFFACHDVLEELWSDAVGEERQLLKGLIHAAVALFHFQEGNPGGARKMHCSALHYLSTDGDSCVGIDLTRFRREFAQCFAELTAADEQIFLTVRLDPKLIPQLRPDQDSQ
ncbi:DUF309 domain-containing protein [Planctomicrobium sp. SH664]|uniref:DUF309 domain-containing protein n=1 Tax=Planctomicrobium sp. SH664 TaxID=3448125 RepID=UPI003F5BB046